MLGRFSLLLLIVFGLSACSDGAPAPSAIDGRALCLDADCGRKVSLVDLPQLENLHATPEGRLFVTGQFNWYELSRSGEGWSSRALLERGEACGGMARRGAHLFAICGGALLSLDLGRPDAPPQRAGTLTGMTLANGMALGPDGLLYITDGPVAVTPKIVRVRVSDTDPPQLLGQETWRSTFPEFPNGLAVVGNAFYTTLYLPPIGHVARIRLLPDGQPGPIERLYRLGIPDDLSVAGDTLLVTDWQGGRLLQLDLEGQLLQATPLLSFSQPSAVAAVGPPLFERPVVLATERYLGRGLWAWKPDR